MAALGIGLLDGQSSFLSRSIRVQRPDMRRARGFVWAAPMNGRFYILSVDGGGFRGAYAAHLLERMEETWHIDWRGTFAMFAGTSTGSILSAGLACGISASALCDFYRQHGRAVFQRRLCSWLDPLKLFTSRYSSSTLYALLSDVFGDVTLGDVQVPLIMPSVDIGTGCVHLLKSKFDSQFVRDPSVRVADAVMASCSAPTYFDPHLVRGVYQLVDGGLWANNPSLVAVTDAHYRLRVPLEDVRVLSIGTGKSKSFYPRTTSWWRDCLLRSWQGWGFATRWQTSRLLDLILNLQSDTAHNMLCLLLGQSPQAPHSVCRITFESYQCLPLDSPRKLDDWIRQADHDFTHNAQRIATFLSIPGADQCSKSTSAST